MKTEEIVNRNQGEIRRGFKGSTAIIALMAGYSMVYMDKMMVSAAVVPIAEQFSLTPAQTGIIMSFFFLGYSLMQIPGGWLADRIGAKKVLLLSLGIISLFSYVFGMVSSLMLFVVIRFFAGIGHGGYPPSCSKSVAENFPQERRTFVQSLILSTSGIGGVLAFTVGAYLISQNWRYSYAALGSLFLIAFILVAIFVPQDAVSRSSGTRKPNLQQVITHRNVIILCISMLLLNFLLYGNSSWLPSYLSKEFSLSIQTAGLLLAVNACLQFLATMSAGVLLSRFFAGKERTFIMGGGIVSALLVVGFVLSSNFVVSMLLLFLLTMVSVSVFAGIFTWPHKIMDASIIGSSIGVINTGGTLGGFLAPMILGQLITVSGGSFTLAFGLMAVASLFAGLVVLGVKTGGE